MSEKLAENLSENSPLIRLRPAAERASVFGYGIVAKGALGFLFRAALADGNLRANGGSVGGCTDFTQRAPELKPLDFSPLALKPGAKLPQIYDDFCQAPRDILAGEIAQELALAQIFVQPPGGQNAVTGKKSSAAEIPPGGQNAVTDKISSEQIFQAPRAKNPLLRPLIISPHQPVARLLPSEQFCPSNSDLELISPAIAPHHALARAGAHIRSELDFFAPALPSAVLISGTNGKTTTTAAAAALLGVRAVGNIGCSLAAALAERVAVIEASSFALHYSREFAPEVYALTNIAPDHLDWHGDFASYFRAKLSPLERMQPGALALLPAHLSGHFRTRARVVFYSHESDLARFFGFKLEPIYRSFTGVMALDVAIACAISCALAGRVDEQILANFRPHAHRCEIFESGGVAFCDDSKATNAHAANACVMGLLGRFRRVHLLLGGDDKGQDLRPLLRSLAASGRVSVYGIGARDNSALLREFFAGACWGSFGEQIRRAAAECAPGEVVALSPACSSLDEFGSYAQRGEIFAQIAKGLR